MKFFHLNFAIVLCLCIVTPTEQAFDNGLKTFVATLAGVYKNTTASRITDIIFYYNHMRNMDPDKKIWLVMMEYNGTVRERTSFVAVEKKDNAYQLNSYLYRNPLRVTQRWGDNPSWRRLGDLHSNNVTSNENCKRIIYIGDATVYTGTWPQWPECHTESAPEFQIVLNCRQAVIKTSIGDITYRKLFINYPPNVELAPSGHPCET